MKKILSTLIFGASVMSIAASGYADYRPYIDLGVGYAEALNMPDGNDFSNLGGVLPVGTSSSTANNYGGRLAAGVMWDTETLLAYGIEAAAASYGMTKYANDASSVEMNYYGLELLGVAQINAGKVRLIGKAGAVLEQLHPTKGNINNEGLNDSQQVLPEVGAGIAYAFTPHFQLGLTFYHTFGNDVSFNDTAGAENLPSVDLAFLEAMYMV